MLQVNCPAELEAALELAKRMEEEARETIRKETQEYYNNNPGIARAGSFEFYVQEELEYARLDFLRRLKDNIEFLETYFCFVGEDEEGCKKYDMERGKTVLYKDFAPYSFGFDIYQRRANGEYAHWMRGGLIFHGPHDKFGSGDAPTFSVSITPEHGWSIHT